MIGNGLLPARVGGLVKTTLWSVIQASLPKPTAETPAECVTAFRSAMDLENNPVGVSCVCVPSPIISFIFLTSDPLLLRIPWGIRTSSTAALCARRSTTSFSRPGWCLSTGRICPRNPSSCGLFFFEFLNPVPAAPFSNQSLLAKFYHPESFLRTCPPPVMDELLLALQPLLVLDFRLFTSFEARRLAARSSARGRQEQQRVREQEQRQREEQHQRAVLEVGKKGAGVGLGEGLGVGSSCMSLSNMHLGHKQPRMQRQCVRAIYPNIAADEDELQFEEDDILEVEYRVSETWLMCVREGVRGLVSGVWAERTQSRRHRLLPPSNTQPSPLTRSVQRCPQTMSKW